MSYSFEASLQVTLLLDGEVFPSSALQNRLRLQTIDSNPLEADGIMIYSQTTASRKLCQRDIRTQDETWRPTSVHQFEADLGIDHEFVEAGFCMLLIPQTTEMCPAYSVNSPPAINPQLFICH